MFKKLITYLKNFDWILFAAVMLLLSFGLLELYSIALSQGGADLLNFQKQLMFVGIGIVILFALAFFDYHNLRSLSNYIYLFGLIILVGVLFLGTEIRGTRGWYFLGPLSIQPVELAKVILVIFLARYFSGNTVKISPIKHLIVSGIGTFLFIILVLRQPDFGSALILFLVWAAMLFISGFKKKYILIIVLILALVFLSGWFIFFKDYQKDRIITFFNPESAVLGEGYNITQAKIAVGSGRLIGRGVGFGSQSQLKFLPEAQNDFIFAVISEELGFLGVSLVLGIFAVFFYRIILATRKLNNDFAIYFLLAVAVLIFIEMFINIGMNIGLMPVIGISLPFLSYGGSAIVSTLIMIGIVESIIIRSKLKYY